MSTYHKHLLYSSLEECLTHSHLLYSGGMQVSQALLYTTVEEGFTRLLPLQWREGKDATEPSSALLLYSTVEESSTHSHPSTVEGRRDASECLPSPSSL